MHRLLVTAAMVTLLSGNSDAQSARRAPSPSEIRLYARLLSMTDSRRWDKSLVDSALASGWRPLRAAAAISPGQIGRAHGLPALSLLYTLVNDRDVDVAANAAYALGLLHDSTSVGALSQSLGLAAEIAREAAWSLGEIGGPARSAILRGLASLPRDDALAIQLLLAAAKLKPVPVAELRSYLQMKNRPSVQWAAAYAIARTRAPAGVRDMVSLTAALAVDDFASHDVASPSPAGRGAIPTAEAYLTPLLARQRTRAEIARALSKEGAGDSLVTIALPVLHRLANDTHPHVRINAIRSLASYGASEREAVTAATGDTDANVRITAAQSLGTVLDSAARVWAPLWQRDTSFMYRASLLASSVRAGARLPYLSEWSAQRAWHHRAAALAAAGASKDEGFSRRIAETMLKDADGRVRAGAYGLLSGSDTAALSPQVHSLLRVGLGDPDFYARATALSILSGHPAATDVPAVLAAYTRSLADSGNDARIAAIGYLAAAWKKDSLEFPADLKRQLATLRPSDDPLVRAQAESVSVFSSWPSTSGNPRQLAWYENIVRQYVVPALQGQTQRATLRTRRGDIVLELFGADAPITVWNFMNLARTGYYRGTGFHRVVPNFVAQDGDPRDDGNGGPGYAIRDEMNRRRYERGALGMALSGPDTGGSQYFITHSPQPHLDGHYTVFGRVVRGYPALDAIVQGDRILSITVQ